MPSLATFSSSSVPSLLSLLNGGRLGDLDELQALVGSLPAGALYVTPDELEDFLSTMSIPQLSGPPPPPPPPAPSSRARASSRQREEQALEEREERAARLRQRSSGPPSSLALPPIPGLHFSHAPRWLQSEPVCSASQIPSLRLPPGPCAFLRAGQRFEGSQHLPRRRGPKGERWVISVALHRVDLRRGLVCGTLEATCDPAACHSLGERLEPTVTFFEGDIVDNVNHSFAGASDAAAARSAAPSAEVELSCWSLFASFAPLARDVRRCGGRSAALSAHGAIYMRWRERFFVRGGGSDSVSIAGVYYVALDRTTGAISGLYCESCASTSQKVDLKPLSTEAAGKAFAEMELA